MKKHFLRWPVWLAILFSIALLTGCTQQTEAGPTGLVLDLSGVPALREGDTLAVSALSVRLAYADGRYAEVTSACAFEMDGVAYDGGALTAGTHTLTARYSLTDGRFYTAEGTIRVLPAPDPGPHTHRFGAWQAGVPSTCTAEGTVGHKDCTDCHKHFDAEGVELTDLSLPIDPEAHAFGEWETVQKPTCTGQGLQKRVCAHNAAHSETHSLQATPHSYGSWHAQIDATLLSEGTLGHYICEGCKGYFDRDGRPLTDLTLPRRTPTYDRILRDLSASAYDLAGGDLSDPARGLFVRVVTSGSYAGMAEVQTQPVSDGKGTYTLTLPRVDLRVCPAVRLTFRTNNAEGISADGERFVPAEGTTLTLLCDGTRALLTLSAPDGTVLQSAELTDPEVLGGVRGLTLYVKGIRYTSVYLSPMTGMDISPEPEQSRLLDLRETLSDDMARYAVVYDPADRDMALVAEDLAELLYDLTGLRYRVFAACGALAIDDNSHYIVLGGGLAGGKGLSVFGLTQSNGFNIRQDHTNLYVYAQTAYGTIRGVYGLLEELAGMKFYTADVYTCDRGSALTVPAGYTLAVNYAFNSVVAGTAEAAYDRRYAYRLGMLPDWLAFGGAGVGLSSNVHNYLDILPYETYGADHPSWYTRYSDVGTYVIHLDPDDDVMVRIVTDSLIAALSADPTQEIFVFGQADTGYGPDTGRYLAFVNAVSQKIDAYLGNTAPARRVTVAMLAYRATYAPPENGTFYCGSNARTAVLFAPVGGRHNSAYSDGGNLHKNTSDGTFDTETVAARLSEWADLPGATVLCWFYGTDYFDYFMPFDTMSALQDNIRLAHAAGDGMLFYQLQTYGASTVGSDWQRLKLYLTSRLAKDVDADVGTLIDDFCRAYFGAAADTMRQLLTKEYADLYRNRNAGGHGDWYGLINGSALLLDKKCFARSDLRGYMKTIDEAKAQVEKSFSDGDLTSDGRDAILRRIDIESLTFRYLLITLHSYTGYDASTEAFFAFARSLGVLAASETA